MGSKRRRPGAFVRLVRMALLAYPSERRHRDGAEIEAAAREAFHDRRRRQPEALVFAVRVLGDLLWMGLRERARQRREEGDGTMMWSDGWMDLRLAARTLARAPGFTASAIFMLALGIGANTAVFSALRATLLAPPPYPQHERLVFLDLTDSSTLRPGPPRAFPFSYPKFEMLETMGTVPVEAAAAFAVRSLTLTGSGDASYVATEFVTPEYFGVIGVEPTRGRDFIEDDNAVESPLVTILGHGLWTDRYGGDPDVVGRDVILNGRPVTVVGVAPEGFDGLSGKARLWLPVSDGAALTAPFLVRGAYAHWLRVIARMDPGMDLSGLQVRMAEAGRAIDAAYPGSDPTVVRGGSAQTLDEEMVNPQAETALWVLAAASVLLLFVACANLAGLLVARVHARSRDGAVRSALGAGRWRVARGHLLEALLLAGAGCLAALFVADMGLSALGALWPDRFVDGSWNVRAPRIDGAGIDVSTVAFAAFASLVTALFVGLLPALTATGREPATRLGTRSDRVGERSFAKVRSTLVVGEIAMALMLVVGAGLLLRSITELSRVDRGFEAESLLTFDFSIPRESQWGQNPASFRQQLLERLQAEPGVESAALACVPPLAGHCSITGVRAAGDRVWPEGSRPPIGVNPVSDGFFETLGTPVLQGRTFTSADQADSQPVVVLSEAAVRELFPDDPSPIGRTISALIGLTPEDGPRAEVIGVVGDILFDRPANGVMPELFVSHRQEEEGESTVLVRARGEPLSVVPRARAVMADLDPDVPLFGVRTLDDLEATAAGDTRVLGMLLTGFAILALLLACTGVWAIVSFAVTRRTREIGVRVALGADSGAVVRAIQRRCLLASLVGVLVGAALAAALSRLLASVLFGVGTADPLTFVLAGILLVGVSALASWVPARRATRVDPMVALRAE